MAGDEPIAVRSAPARRVAEEWALVLASQGLSPTLGSSAEAWTIAVPAQQAERAEAALAAYESERGDPIQREAIPLWAGDGALRGGLLVAAGLLAAHLATETGVRGPHWVSRGAADAAQILSGEAWRVVTALTLHLDAGHVVSNVLALGLFLPAVFRLFGPGLGGALVLLAGAGGNGVNAFVHQTAHVSVGASTAVFGAVGLLGACGIMRRRRIGTRGPRMWIPLAAALALLATLGTSGERTDFWAHGLGFAVGAGLGLGIGRWLDRPPSPALQWVLGVAAIATLVGSWMLAI